MASGDADFGA